MFPNKWRVFVALTAVSAASLLAQSPSPYGIHPRQSPADYAAQQQTSDATYAASVVPHDEVKRLFSVDISKTYVVLEVACYPAQGNDVKLSADEFVVRADKDYTHPADAVTVASVIQEKNAPPPPSNRNVNVTTTAEIGYESETDPTTGRKVHGTYTGVGTAVSNGPDYGPYPPPPGSTDYDRMTLQQQLEQRALPGGTFNAPTAGFLYFPVKELKKKKDSYELEYLASASGTVRLSIPAKAH